MTTPEKSRITNSSGSAVIPGAMEWSVGGGMGLMGGGSGGGGGRFWSFG